MQITQTPNGHYLTVSDGLSVKLSTSELYELRASIDTILINMLSTGQARRLAAERGVDVPAQTLLSACERGNIPGAEKDGARWRIPQPAFEKWLNS